MKYPERALHIWAIWFLFGTSLLIRLVGMGSDLVFQAFFNPDELVDTASRVSADLHPHWFYFPSLFLYILQGFHCLLYLGMKWLSAFDANFQAFLQKSLLLRYYADRLLCCSFGVFSLYILSLIGRRLKNPRVGWIACLFLAFSPLHVDMCHFATIYSTLCLFTLLSLYYIVILSQNGSAKAYLGAAACIGLTASIQYNLMTLAAILPVAHFCHSPKRRPIWWLGLALIGVGCCFFWASPYILLDFSAFWKDISHEWSYVTPEKSGSPFSSFRLWTYGEMLVTQLGPMDCAIIGLFVLVGLIAYRSTTILLLSFPLIHLLGMSFLKLKLPRYLVPVLPFLFLQAAVGIDFFINRMSRRRQIFALGLIFAAWAIHPLASLQQNLHLFWQADSRFIATQWIRDHIPAGSSLAIESNHHYGPSLDPNAYQIMNIVSIPADYRQFYRALWLQRVEYLVISTVFSDESMVTFHEFLKKQPEIRLMTEIPGTFNSHIFRNPTILIYKLEP